MIVEIQPYLGSIVIFHGDLSISSIFFRILESFWNSKTLSQFLNFPPEIHQVFLKSILSVHKAYENKVTYDRPFKRRVKILVSLKSTNTPKKQ